LKRWRMGLAALLALLAIGFLLLWFMPARWAMPWLASRLPGVRLQEVSGLLWDGRAGQVLSSRGENLGQLSWRLSRRALLGDTLFQVNLSGPRLGFSGQMSGRSSADALWTDVHAHADLDLLPANFTLPIGRPRGSVELAASHVQLQGGWPSQLDAQLQWQRAALLTPRNGEVSLGTLQLALQGSNGVIGGHLHDDGQGPLRIAGDLQLSPLARRFTAQASTRGANASLQRWLTSLGSTDAGGITRINYSGGLAAAIPEGRR
jgi:general secretion pathway protein N